MAMVAVVVVVSADTPESAADAGFRAGRAAVASARTGVRVAFGAPVAAAVVHPSGAEADDARLAARAIAETMGEMRGRVAFAVDGDGEVFLG